MQNTQDCSMKSGACPRGSASDANTRARSAQFSTTRRADSQQRSTTMDVRKHPSFFASAHDTRSAASRRRVGRFGIESGGTAQKSLLACAKFGTDALHRRHHHHLRLLSRRRVLVSQLRRQPLALLRRPMQALPRKCHQDRAPRRPRKQPQ